MAASIKKWDPYSAKNSRNLDHPDSISYERVSSPRIGSEYLEISKQVGEFLRFPTRFLCVSWHLHSESINIHDILSKELVRLCCATLCAIFVR